APVLPPRVLRALTILAVFLVSPALYAAESEFDEDEESEEEIAPDVRGKTTGSEARRESTAAEAAPKEEIHESQADGFAYLTDECNGDKCPALAAPHVDLSGAKLHRRKNDVEVARQPAPGGLQLPVGTSVHAGSRLDPLAAPGA